MAVSEACAVYAKRLDAQLDRPGQPPLAPNGCVKCLAVTGRHEWSCDEVTPKQMADALGIAAEPTDPVDEHMASAALDPDSGLVGEVTEYLRDVAEPQGPPIIPGRPMTLADVEAELRRVEDEQRAAVVEGRDPGPDLKARAKAAWQRWEDADGNRRPRYGLADGPATPEHVLGGLLPDDYRPHGMCDYFCREQR